MIFLHSRWNSLMLSACTLLSLAQRLQWKCETYTRIQANSEFAPQSQARSTFMKTNMDLTRSTPTKKIQRFLTNQRTHFITPTEQCKSHCDEAKYLLMWKMNVRAAVEAIDMDGC